MIQLLSTTWVVKNSTTVELEGGLICLDCNSNWLLRGCCFQCILVSRGNICVAFDCYHRAVLQVTFARAGGSVTRRVRVISLRGNTVLLYKLEGIVHQATPASMVVSSVALHQVLFTERHQLATCNEVHRRLRGLQWMRRPSKSHSASGFSQV